MKITNAVLMRSLDALLCWYVKRIERQITQIDPHRISTCADRKNEKRDMMRRLLIAVSLFALANALAVPAALAQESGASPISAMTTADWQVAVVTDDLSYPWDIARAGNLIVMTEAGGNIVTIEDGRLKRYAVQTSDPIVHDGGSGLLGMALAADFQTSGLAYLYHSYRSASRLTNKVIQARFDGQSWRETRVLLAGIPGHRLYNGGRIAIGPDGPLYVTTGWTENGELPQDLGSLAGKILRMTRDGQVPEGNPFKGSYVYSSGHRNPAGPCVERRRRSVRRRTRTVGP